MPSPASLPQIAIEGCCHGELDKIYETIAYLEQREGTKIDLLICCGDFQARQAGAGTQPAGWARTAQATGDFHPLVT